MVFGRRTVSAETGVTLGALLWGDQDQDWRSEIMRIMVDQMN